MVTRKSKKKEVRYSNAKKVAEQQDSGFSPKTFKIPEGMKQHKWKKEGTHKIEVVPFAVSEDNPLVKNGTMEEGDLHYELTFYDHHKIGPNNERHLCLAKIGKKCPVCQEGAKMARDPKMDDELRKDMFPKTRQLILIYDHADKDAGLQIHEEAFNKGFGELLKNKIEADKDDDFGYANFYRLGDEGMTLHVTVEEKSFSTAEGARKYFAATNIEMTPRKKALPDEIADAAPCLDELLTPTSYDRLKSIFLQEDDEDEDEDEPKKKKPKAKSKPVDDDEDEEDEEEEDDEEDDEEEEKPAKKKKGKGKSLPTADDAGIEVGTMVEHDEYGECKVVHVSDDGTALRIKDEDGEVHRAIGVADVEVLDEEEDEDEPPKKKGKKKPVKDDIDEDDEEEEEEEEEEDEDEDDDPPPKKKGKVKPSKKSKDEDEEEEEDDDIPFDDEDDEDEDEPPVKKKKVKGKK